MLAFFFFFWLALAPLAAEAVGLIDQQPTRYLHLLGGLGPLVAAFAVTAAVDGKAGVRGLGGRIVFFGHGWRWLAIAIFGPLALLVIGVLSVAGATGSVMYVWAGWDQELRRCSLELSTKKTRKLDVGRQSTFQSLRLSGPGERSARHVP